MRVCYLKRSSSPYCNFLPDQINCVYYFESRVLIIFANMHVSLQGRSLGGGEGGGTGVDPGFTVGERESRAKRSASRSKGVRGYFCITCREDTYF